MVAGRLLCQMVWRQAPWATELKTVSRTSNQPKHSEKGESSMKDFKTAVSYYFWLWLSPVVFELWGQIALINLQLARCASSLLNQELCVDGNLARDPQPNDSSEHR